MKPSKTPAWLIVAGGVFFIVVLAVSAWWEADIRWLHFFQSWMYLAAIGLSLRRSRWGYFIGIAAAGLWDYGSLFVNTFFLSGLHETAHWLHTGHLQRPDQFIAVPAWTANLLVVIGCLWGYARLKSKSPRDLAAFVMTFVLTSGYFALDMAICQPRYLPFFRGLLHPHWPRW